MEKEKIILGNGTELSYDSIGFSGNTLVVGFVNGDAADLESKIRAAGQNNLEEIQQLVQMAQNRPYISCTTSSRPSISGSAL